MTHIDLFSGIGGFALAAEQVWGDDYHNLFFCDINKFCQAVLRKNFGKEILIYDDIKEVSKEKFVKKYGKVPYVDLLTAGPPCQPASQAGNREGENDDRWLWQEMFTVIQDYHPTWCLIENVYGLLSLERGVVFETLFSKMESLGYEVQPIVIGAVGKNAPHKRYRVFFIAHDSNADKCRLQKSRPEQQSGRIRQSDENDTDPKCEGYVRRGCGSDSNGTRVHENKQAGKETWGATSRCNENVGNAEGTGQQGRFDGQRPKQHGRAGQSGFEGWDENWYEIATRLCRVDDGLPVKLDELKLTKPKHREQRLKALGNAVVVPLIASLLRLIKQADEAPIEEENIKKNQVEHINIDEKKDRYMITKTLKNFGVE